MDDVALVIGESLVDVTRTADDGVVRFPGGSAANVAVALARLGRPTSFATSFADDAPGQLVAEHLAAAGVTLAVDPHVVPRTTTATAEVDRAGAASYTFDVDWRLRPLPETVHPRVLHVCSYSALVEPGADQVRATAHRLSGHSAISYDINLRPTLTGVGPEVIDGVLELVGVADLVKASDEDLLAAFPGQSIAASAAALLARGPAAVVVTRGAEGAECHWSGGSVRVAAPRTRVVDTIGAGDTFSAGMIDALWESGLLAPELLRAAGADVWRPVLEHATRAAAVTVSRPGADPPYRHELAP